MSRQRGYSCWSQHGDRSDPGEDQSPERPVISWRYAARSTSIPDGLPWWVKPGYQRWKWPASSLFRTAVRT